MKKYNKGITLIALVITIIILLVLAMVSIKLKFRPSTIEGKAGSLYYQVILYAKSSASCNELPNYSK